MPKLPDDRSEVCITDYKPAYSPVQAAAEANRCFYCVDAPCIAQCPTAINIPEFIRKISTANVEGAARTIFASNILGMSCARVCPVEVLCVGACVYNELDAPPIEIGKLQRYATDAAFAAGWEFFQAGPDTGKSVGLIGGGPAALAAAHELRRLGHAVTIYDAGEQDGTAYIAMELLRGRHLVEYAAAARLLPPAIAIEVTARLAEALHYAHQQGVVHRDVKPANVVFDPPSGELKITDFGIARLTDSGRTRTGLVLGTPSFMSPEQLQGRAVTGRSDLFSLAVTLFPLLTGQDF
jgi:hypothetical protein